MLVAPAIGGRNEIARFKVKTVAAAETLDPAPFRTHWLFSCVPLPGVIDPADGPPASVKRDRVFLTRS